MKEMTTLKKVLELGSKLPMFLSIERNHMVGGSDFTNSYFAVFPQKTGFFGMLNGFKSFEKYRHLTKDGRLITLYFFRLSRNEFYKIFNILGLKEVNNFVKENELMKEYRIKNKLKKVA